ncbi:lysophospholipase-like protein 1 [Uranotaenia lowii]|uniref:lysophospholipase-like protein 1 n=1 Tax=Uranotaenia lowii TaxID=190385 RepID=UPI002478F1C6|nr:lysophospholipase-like protein 1 [Uranotaenia lowii]XP_055613837.1 lysophospholipase-like protein 1 [Uranotaenia lowii]
MSLEETVFKPIGKYHVGTVIFFHAAEDNGEDFAEFIRLLLGRRMEFRHIKVIFPTAPLQTYTPKGGRDANVWFNWKRIERDCPEMLSSLASIYDQVEAIIEREISEGVPAGRIIVGGFEMGGTMALHTAFRVNRDLGGVFTLSSFLNSGSIVYDSMEFVTRDERLPELLMIHGELDNLIPVDWGRATFEELTNFGVQGEFVTQWNMAHEIRLKHLQQIIQWILMLVPPPRDDIPTPPPRPAKEESENKKDESEIMIRMFIKIFGKEF